MVCRIDLQEVVKLYLYL